MDRKTTILYFITSLGTGGAEITLRKIVSGIDQNRFSVRVVSLRPVGEIGELIRCDGFDVYDMGMDSKYNVIALIRLFIFFRRERPDILHTFLSHANILGRVLGRLAGIRIIISSIRNEQFGGWVRERMLAWTDRLASMTAIVSQKAADRMLSLGIVSRDKHVVIRNGYDLEALSLQTKENRTSARRSLGIADDALVLVTSGRLVEQKGYEYLIDAMATVHAEFPDATLFVLGEGEREQALRAQVQDQGLGVHVRFVGVSPHPVQYYHAADVFVLASLWEGFSNVIVEAMACGLPVVATDVGGAREALDHEVSGFIIPSRDTRALADAILKMLRMPASDRITIGKAGNHKVSQNFSLERMIGIYEELYKTLLERG